MIRELKGFVGRSALGRRREPGTPTGSKPRGALSTPAKNPGGNAKGNVPDGTPDVLGYPIGGIDRDAVTDLVPTQLGARRSAWNAADIRGEVEKILATTGVITTGNVRRELAEDLTTSAVDRSPGCSTGTMSRPMSGP